MRFEATPEDPAAKLHYEWIFGDGSVANGHNVTHKFPDTDGTMRDGTGLFYAALHVSNDSGRQTWIGDPVIVRDTQNPALPTTPKLPGVAYSYQPLSEGADAEICTPGTTSTIALAGIPHRAEDYTLAFSTNLDVPKDGGYTFTVIANDGSSVAIDGKQLGTGPQPFAQVCGLAGNAARPIVVAAELAKGLHHLEVKETHHLGVDNFQVYWQGPGIPLQAIPADRLSQP